MLNRRSFVSQSSAFAVASGLWTQAAHSKAAAQDGKGGKQNPIAVFAKPLQTVPADELGRRLKDMGVAGIEATLRKGGQIEPADFSQKLSKLCESLARHGQQIIIAASDINSASADSEKTLRLFAELGIRYFRMSYYKYTLDEPVLKQLERYAKQAQGLAKLCAQIGITGLYQNHAGKEYVGAGVWDMLRVLDGIDPKQIAFAIDIRHTALELTESWPIAYGAIRPHLGAVFVKDFAWRDGKHEEVPLGEGRSRPLWNAIAADGFEGPISVHMEHIDHVPEELLPKRWAATAKDVATLKSWLGTS